MNARVNYSPVQIRDHFKEKDYVILFHTCYPTPDHNYHPEFEAAIIDDILSSKYPPGIYNKKKLLVVGEDDHRLAKGFARVTPAKLNDPIIKCFYENNPDYARGNEIPVIARITPENLVRMFVVRLLPFDAPL